MAWRTESFEKDENWEPSAKLVDPQMGTMNADLGFWWDDSTAESYPFHDFRGLLWGQLGFAIFVFFVVTNLRRSGKSVDALL